MSSSIVGRLRLDAVLRRIAWLAPLWTPPARELPPAYAVVPAVGGGRTAGARLTLVAIAAVGVIAISLGSAAQLATQPPAGTIWFSMTDVAYASNVTEVVPRGAGAEWPTGVAHLRYPAAGGALTVELLLDGRLASRQTISVPSTALQYTFAFPGAAGSVTGTWIVRLVDGSGRTLAEGSFQPAP